MTIDELIALLEPDDGWLLYNGSAALGPHLRRLRKFSNGVVYEMCPLTRACEIVTTRALISSNYMQAGDLIGMKPNAARKVADAADATYEHDTELRARLLAACMWVAS